MFERLEMPGRKNMRNCETEVKHALIMYFNTKLYIMNCCFLFPDVLSLGNILQDLPKTTKEPGPMLLLSRFSGLRASDCEEVAGESWDLFCLELVSGINSEEKNCGVKQ